MDEHPELKRRAREIPRKEIPRSESRTEGQGPEQHAQSSREDLMRKVRGHTEGSSTRDKWAKGLIILGAITILDSCSPFPIPLVGPPAIIFGSVLILIGTALLVKPGASRRKDTTEAIYVAMRHHNRLTVARLVVEMDISLDRAESIIQTLVKKGIAEIDLDANDPDGGITYKIKGL
ncbi:MAG: hypothetical protein AB1646_13280 [Thermodesulfobacteriota bacterium]